MATTETTLPGDGTAGPFTYTFPALVAENIYVSVDGTAKTAGVDYNLDFVNSQITFLNTPYPTAAEVIRIYRDTDDAALSANFYSGAAIRATDLNNNFNQALYIAQETKNLTVQASTGNLADGSITSNLIANGAVTTTKISDNNVTTAKLADNNVTTAKLADNNVTTAKLADSSVTTAKLADSNVTTAKLADSNVTTAKLADSSVTSTKIADGVNINFNLGTAGDPSFTFTGDTDTGLFSPGANILGISTNGTERIRVNALGALKASTTGSFVYPSDDSHEFTTNDSDYIAKFTNTDSSGPSGILIKYSAAAPNSNSKWFITCSDSAADRFIVYSNGGIANYQANNVNLSDINTKKNISSADDAWNCLKQWEIVKYHYKDQPDDADLNLGVIAQQIAGVCPEVVTTYQEAQEANGDTPAREELLGIKEQQMMWMAFKALQEAQHRIEQLESVVVSYDARLKALENN
ncbi:tail fiber [Synechococcus phage S-CBP4]|uniref:Tail fiber n=1 Tax=Synechococcus phage S-CBP4 TaxID=754059 RepID=M1PL72_9CAUD|nr:tail fiber protein [Synechococcus phage S-CBP4]YP_009822200.1 tail fiber protein [Synechococcus phage S-CBP4]AGF91700.1 hypothetical protein SVPG_00017 [Synechococcus phage S-CBP4]AGK86643.1 tail fiber [Synechococcus phage S-CBP4]